MNVNLPTRVFAIKSDRLVSESVTEKYERQLEQGGMLRSGLSFVEVGS